MSRNIKTWVNYSKAKGNATNKDNQRNLVRMEIRAILGNPRPEQELGKHINFDIKHLRENSEKLYIDEDADERKVSERLPKEHKETCNTNTRETNNKLRNLPRGGMWGKQKRNSHNQRKTKQENRKTISEINKEKGTDYRKNQIAR